MDGALDSQVENFSIERYLSESRQEPRKSETIESTQEPLLALSHLVLSIRLPIHNRDLRDVDQGDERQGCSVFLRKYLPPFAFFLFLLHLIMD